MIKINLAPPIAKKRVALALPAFNLGYAFAALYLVVLGLIGLWWVTVSGEVTQLRAEIAREQREAERLKTVIAEGQRFKRDKEALERRVNAIESVARNQTRPVYLFDAAADLLPRDLWLTRMEEKGGRVAFAGVAFSSVSVADFMANLKASGKFKDVDLVESRQDLTKSPRTITFEVTCRFEI